MATIVDIETILDDIKTLLKGNLNAKIAEIQAQKDDDIQVAPIDDNAYELQTLNDRVMSYDPFILIGVDNIKSMGNGPATASLYSIGVILSASDTGQDSSIARRMFRYSRALREVLQLHFTGLRSEGKMVIESLTPIAWTLMNTENEYRSVGVSIQIGLA